MSRDALIVGINNYQYLPGLNAPARDAEAIASHLQAVGEFRVHRVPEIIQDGHPCMGAKSRVSLKELETALVQLFKPKGSTVPQTALLYFSGHGIQKEAGINEGYLAVSDSNPATGFYGLSLFWLRRLLQESPVRQRIIVLDCCHSGELLNFLEADPGARPGTDRLFMAASREYESAYESLDSPYSVFTKALLDGLDPSRTESGIVTNHTLTAAVSRALTGEIQQPLFESSGSEIILTRCTGPATPIQQRTTSDTCPYRGLEFFDEAHAEYFFGREELTDRLLDKLRQGQFVAVVGASGSGKSSLVRAGLIWELRRGYKFSGSDRWPIKLLTPGEHPMRSLASVFIDPDLPDLDRAEQLRRAETFLQDGGQGLAQLVQASLPLSSGTTTLQTANQPHMVLIIDQFEEVFTLSHGTQAEQERQQFFDSLLGALRSVGDRLSIVTVLRADFLSKCSLYPQLAQYIERNLVLVSSLTYDQIKATILRPAQKVGLECEPNLVYTMLLDVIGAPGELPLLQYTLLELWQRRQPHPEGGPSRLTLDTYTELGGIRGTLQKRATEIFYSLTLEEQTVAKRIFLSLTQLGEGTEDTRRRVLKAELVSPAFSAELVERALEKLVTAKLVVTNREEQPPSALDIPLEQRYGALVPISNPSSYRNCHETIDVVHEALIRNWPLLRGWLDENREMLRRQRRIEQAALEWQASGQLLEAEYLLRGSRLIDAEDFVSLYPYELSALAYRYVAVSLEESKRAKQESRLLQIAVPSVLVIALIMTFNQYRSALQTQADREYQLNIATSRERAAIAQSILREPGSDPTAALLISRLAAERGEVTYEAQSSLRDALQNLRLQLELEGFQGAVHQLTFSQNQRYLAAGSQEGTVYLWDTGGPRLYLASPSLHRVLSVAQPDPTPGKANPIAALTLSREGHRIAAIAHDSTQIQVWNTGSGEALGRIQLQQFTPHLHLSSEGQWLVAPSNSRTVAVWQTDNGRLLQSLPLPATLTDLTLSADGRMIAAGTGNQVQRWVLKAVNGQLQVAPLTALVHPAIVTQVTISPTGRWIMTTARDGATRLWDSSTGRLQHTLVPTGRAVGNLTPLAVREARFSPNEQVVALSTLNGQLWLWKLPSRHYWRVETGTSSANHPIDLVGFSPDGHTLLATQTSGKQRFVQLWNVNSGASQGTLPQPLSHTDKVQFSPDGTYVVTGSASGALRFWTTAVGGELPTLQLPMVPARWLGLVQPPPAMDGSPTTGARVMGELVAIAADGSHHRWEFWDAPDPVSSPSPTALPALHTASIQSRNYWQWFMGFFSRQTTPSQAIALDGPLQPPTTLKERSSQRPKVQTSEFNQRGVLLTAAALSTQGDRLALADADHWIEIRHIAPGQGPKTLHRFQNMRVRNQKPNEFNPANRASDLVENRIHHLSFSPDAQYLLGVSDDLTIHLWNAETGQLVHILKGNRAAVQTAEFSPDGTQVVAVGRDNTIRFWQVSTGQLTRTLAAMRGVMSVSFSPTGQHIVMTGMDGTARLLNVKTGRLEVVLTGHRGAVTGASFSPDGRSLVTVGVDGSARIWDARTGTEQAQLRPNPSHEKPIPIRQALFSADGQYVATLTSNGHIQVWAANWATLLKLSRDRSLRQLTPEECVRYLRLTPDSCPQIDLQ